MSNINSITFAINSNWNSDGVERAKASVASLNAEVDAMSDKKMDVSVNVSGLDEAQQKMSAFIHQHPELKLSINATTEEAQAALEEYKARVEATKAKFGIGADTKDAQAKLEAFIAEAKAQGVDVKITATSDFNKIKSDAERLAKEAGVSIRVKADTAEAQAKIDEAAHDRHSTIKVSSDTSNAKSGISSLMSSFGGLGSYGGLIIAGLIAGILSLGAVAGSVGAIMAVALGGGVVAAGMALITANNKITDSFVKSAASAKEAADSANKDLAQAYQNVADTEIKSAEDIKKANQDVADAKQHVADTAIEGSESIQRANEESVQANRELKQSQEDVTQAYKDAKRSLEDLQMQQNQSADDAESAAIAVQRAWDKVAQGPSAGSKDPVLDQREAVNEYNLALDHQREVLQKNQRTQEDLATAQAKGVEGSKQVVDAKNKEADAQVRANDATRNIQDAQRKATENNTKAQQDLADAIQKAADTQRQAAENNTKAQQDLALAQQKAADAQTNLNQILTKGLSTSHQLLATLAGLAAPLQGPVHAAMQSLLTQLTQMRPAIQTAFGNAAQLVQPMADGLMGMVRNSLPGINTMLGNMRPTIDGLSSGMQTFGTHMSNMWAGMANGAKGFGDIFANLGDMLGTFMETWGKFSGDMAGAGATTIKRFGVGLNDLTGGVLNGSEGFINNAQKGPSLIQHTASGIGNVASKALPALGNVSNSVSSALSPVVDNLSGPLGNLAAGLGGGLAQTIKALAPGLDVLSSTLGKMATNLQPLIPLITAFTTGMGSTFSTELKILSPVLLAISKIIGDMATGLQPLTPLISGLAVAFAVWKTATIAMTIAQAALNLVMDTNPLVLIGIAIAAVVGGIIYLATKTRFFQDVWRDVSNWTKDTWNALKVAWNDTVNFFIAIWNDVSNAVKAAWNDSWTWIKTAAKTIWDGITALWSDEINGIKKIFDDVMSLIKAAWSDGWNVIKDVAKGIWDLITGNWSGFAETFKKGFQDTVTMVKDIWNGIKKIFADPINIIFRIMNDTVGKVIPALHFNEMHGDGYAEGGWTGPGSKYQPAGIVHADEFVISKSSRSAIEASNPGLLDHMNQTGSVPGYADGGQVANDQAIQNAIAWASGFQGHPYNDQGWLDCSGIASGVYDKLIGREPHREFTTVSNFESLGWVRGTGGIAEIGVLPKPGNLGHMVISVGGHNIESGGVHNNIAIDGPAAGPGDSLFTDHYYLPGRLFSPAYDGPGADPGNSSGKGSSGGFFGMIGRAVETVNGLNNKLSLARWGASEAFKLQTDAVLLAIPSPIPGTGSPMGNIPKNYATKLRDEVANFIRGHEDSAGTTAPFSGSIIPSAQHKAIIDQAVALAGGPAPNTLAEWESGFETLVQRESGWNPAAVNNWDINAQQGHPSKGLGQMIDSTFAAHMVPGHGDIWNPVDNLASDVGYIKANYGGITGVQQANANLPSKGYADGTDNAKKGLALVGEKGPEIVQFTGGEKVIPNDQIGEFLRRLFGSPTPPLGPDGLGQKIPYGSTNSNANWSQLNALLQGDAVKGTSDLTSFATANLDQFGSDIGLGSITNGSGFIPQLITQSINYGAKLQNWKPGQNGGLIGMAVGNNGGGMVTNPEAVNSSGPSSTGGSWAESLVSGITGAISGAIQPHPVSSTPQQPQVPQEVHFHSNDPAEGVKQYFEAQRLQTMGFDPY